MRLQILDNPAVRQKFQEKLDKYLVKGEDCWYWSSNHKSSKGYPLQTIGGRAGYSERVSRIMLYLKEKPSTDNLFALHHCDNPGCVNPAHLYWGTAKDNTKDAIDRGRFKNPPVLTRDKASRCYIKTQKDIDQLASWCETMSISEIAQRLGKSYNTTFRLLKRLGLKSKVNMRGVGCRPPRTPSKFEDPLLEKELAELAKTKSVTQLSKYYGVKRDTIYFQLKRLGINAVNERSREIDDSENT